MDTLSITDRSMLEDSIASINPLPPSPAEFKSITGLIEGDQQLIRALEREQTRRQRVLNESQSKVVIVLACLETVNADLARAHKFHDYIQKSNKEVEIFADFTLLEGQYPGNTPKHVRPHLESLDRARVSTVTTPYHDEILKFSDMSAKVLKTASSMVQYHQGALREARSLVEMVQKDLDMISQQIIQLRSAVLRKRFCLQAIWCVPNEVWIAIFAFATGITAGKNGPDKGWIRDDTNWHGALAISMVCRRWRTAITTCPRLWSNIVIVRGKFKKTTIPRVQHYLNLCQDVPKTLLIDGAHSKETLNSPKWIEMWKKHGDIDGIVCMLRKGNRSDLTAQLLTGMPTARKLWLLRAPEDILDIFMDSTYYLTLHSSFSGGLKHIVTELVEITWMSMAGVLRDPQLLSYSVDCPIGESMWRTDMFVPHSIQTLVDLRIRTNQILEPVPVPHEPIVLPQVKTLHTSLNYLVVHISRCFRLPALASLTIIDARDTAPTQYETVKPWVSSACVSSLVCESIHDIGPLPALIIELAHSPHSSYEEQSLHPFFYVWLQTAVPRRYPFYPRWSISSYPRMTGTGAPF